MKRTFFLNIAICVKLIVLGNVINVPSQYTTIQAAINASSNGDTILIGPGVFEEEIVVDKQLSIMGSGVEATKLFLDVANYQYGTLMWIRSDTVSVSNLTMSSNCEFNYLLFADTSYINANYVLFEQSDSSDGMGMSSLFINKGSAVITNCTFVNSTSSQYEGWQANAIFGSNADSVSVVNSIFYLKSSYFDENAIFMSPQAGIHISYSLFWNYNNHLRNNIDVNYTGINGCLDDDPDFVIPDINFNLLWYSPCVDSGDPNILDADGSVSDMGALPFVRNVPEVSSPYITNVASNSTSVTLTIEIINDIHHNQ